MRRPLVLLACLILSSINPIVAGDFDRTGEPTRQGDYPFAQHYVGDFGVSVRLYGIQDADPGKLKIWGEFLVGTRWSAKQRSVAVSLVVDCAVVKLFDSATTIPLKLCRMCSGILSGDWYDSDDQFDIDTFRIPEGERALQVQYTFAIRSDRISETLPQRTQFLDTLMRSGRVTDMTWWKDYREPDLQQWPSYEINYLVPESSHVRVVICRMMGDPIDTVLDTVQGPGFHGTAWLPSDTLSDFMYDAIIQIDDQLDTRWSHFWRKR